MVLGELDSCKKNETRPPTYTIHKNQFKMYKRLKYKPQYHKVLEEHIGRKISDIPCKDIFTDVPYEQGHNRRNNKMGFNENKKLLHD